MNASIAKDQFTFSLGNATYIDTSYEESVPASAENVKGNTGGWLTKLVMAFADWRRKQVVLREMEMLTDRELADIGLTRADVPRVFDPVFAADRPRGRDY